MFALDYRPRTLSDLAGQRHVSKVLMRLLELWRDGKVKMPAGFMFYGVRGSGKTTTARIISMALNCTNLKGIEPCGECMVCKNIQLGVHSSTLEFDAASHGLVDDIRQLREQVMYSHDGNYRVVILDEAHSISKEGFNALLKQLEEPPPNVMYVLVTTQPEKIPETVLSRLMSFEFRPLSNKDIEARLQLVAESEKFKLDPDLAARIADYSDGGLRDALMLMEQLHIANDLTVSGFEELVGTVNDKVCADIIKMAARKDYVTLSSKVDEYAKGIGTQVILEAVAAMLIKVLRVHLGEKVKGIETAVAQSVSKQQVMTLLKVMWDVRRMRKNRSQDRVTLQLAFALMCGDGASVIQAPKVQQVEKKLESADVDAVFS
jgi:DNA polymerase-3 subunit gamma/tau